MTDPADHSQEPAAGGPSGPAPAPGVPDPADEYVAPGVPDAEERQGLTVPPRPGQSEADDQLAIQVEEAMYDVVDPEIGINVVDLGLVYDIWIEDGTVAVIFMTLTSPACPLTDMLTSQAESLVLDVDGITDMRLEWVWMPPWGPQMISEDGRDQMRALGFTV